MCFRMRRPSSSGSCKLPGNCLDSAECWLGMRRSADSSGQLLGRITRNIAGSCRSWSEHTSVEWCCCCTRIECNCWKCFGGCRGSRHSDRKRSPRDKAVAFPQAHYSSHWDRKSSNSNSWRRSGSSQCRCTWSFHFQCRQDRDNYLVGLLCNCRLCRRLRNIAERLNMELSFQCRRRSRAKELIIESEHTSEHFSLTISPAARQLSLLRQNADLVRAGMHTCSMVRFSWPWHAPSKAKNA